VTGANGNSGEWGHNPLPWMTPEEFPGPPCYCGRNGCIEQFVSGTGLSADHQRMTGERLAPPEIAQRAADGGLECTGALTRCEGRLARALAHVMNLLDPHVIVLGGGLSNISRFYTSVPKLWLGFAYGDTARTRLVRAEHGDSSGVRGAAWLWDA